MKERRTALLHFEWVDHQFLRRYWTNFAEFGLGLWRANQPSPQQLARYKKMGVQTVVSLRKQGKQSYNLFEAEACAELLIHFHHYSIGGARRLPPAARILATTEQLAELPRPLLIHCKSGADRTGFAAALVLILIEGRPVREATRQLARKHLHFPHSRSGVLGHVFRVYLRDVEPRGLSFRDWLETEYDPDAITADFKLWRRSLKKFWQ